MNDGKRVFVEQKLIDAAEELASLVEHDFMSPNSALEKVASERSLKPGEITLVARAYNVVQTNDLRETGRSLLEKAGEFVPADATKVCDNLFPKTQQKAAAALANFVRSDEVSMDYFWSPAKLIKAASAAVAPQKPVVKYAHLVAQPAAPVLSEHTKMSLCKQAASRFKEATNAWFNFYTQKSRELEQAVNTAVAYMTRGSAPAVPALRKAAAAYRGENTAAALDVVLAADPRINLYKKASADVPNTEPALDMLDRIVRAVHEKQAAHEMCVVVGAGLHELSELNKYLKKAADWQRDEQHKVASLFADIGGLAQTADTLSNMFSVPTILQTADKAKTEAKDWSPDPIVQNTLDQIDTPTHTANLRRLAVAANLHNVLTSDPHMRGYDPKTVAKAFNQLVQLNPQLLHKDLPVRMALRRQLAQDGLELFEQEQLTKFDNNSGNN
jgi:hypothetical protein